MTAPIDEENDEIEKLSVDFSQKFASKLDAFLTEFTKSSRGEDTEIPAFAKLFYMSLVLESYSKRCREAYTERHGAYTERQGVNADNEGVDRCEIAANIYRNDSESLHDFKSRIDGMRERMHTLKDYILNNNILVLANILALQKENNEKLH